MNDEAEAQDAVTLHRHGAVCEVHIDNPPVNALARQVRAGLARCLELAEADPEIRAVVITSAGRLFSAGADIREFDHEMAPPHLPLLINRFEDSELPIVIALHGTAMGGALELAMGCHYRLALDSAKAGLPEVRIGIIPGAGGTQRMPRLIGVGPALELITTGRTVSADEAATYGLVDEVVSKGEPADLRQRALDFARELIEQGKRPRRTRDLVCNLAPEAFEAARRRIGNGPGTGAANACVAAVEAATRLDFIGGMKREQELFAKCMEAPESAALRHVFFAERRVGTVPGLERASVRDVQRVSIIGAGTMGTGIAMALCDAGLDVTIQDQSDAAVGRGLERIAVQYTRAAERGRLSPDEAEARIRRIGPGGQDDLATADLVIEAVFENLDLKCNVFQDLDRTCKAGAILATNTSTLDVDRIAAATSRPSDVLGLHFFSPANIMRLLEIVNARETGDDVLATAIGLAKRMNKVGVVSGVCDGFIGNRMLEGYLREAGRLLLEIGRPERIDSVLKEWGWAMGPFAVSDLAGIDIGHFVREQRGIDGANEACYAVGEALYQKGRLGQKTGAGFYRYEEGDRRPRPDPDVAEIIQAEAERFGIGQRTVDDDEIVERCLLPLINEGARLLDEGIALRASDIDLVWIHGYGFPPFRGGPMYIAGQMGAEAIRAQLERHGSGKDKFWSPADNLEKLLMQP